MSKLIEEKRKKRKKEILEITLNLFNTQGFKALNLDTVAEHAGCSKSTLYQLFGNKEGLISALNEDVVQELANSLNELDLANLSIEESLNIFAYNALELTLSERHIAVVRTILSESWTVPSLGKDYYKHGRESAQKELAVYLERQVARGLLDISDCYHAATVFFGLLLWDKMMPMIVGAESSINKSEKRLHAKECVNIFLTIYPPLK